MRVNSSKKGGISLVALVITIIVLIILTGAVIVTFMEGGIIDRAKESVFKSDIRTYQEQLAIIRAEDQIAISTNKAGYETKVIDKTLTGTEIEGIIPEFKVEEYGDLVQIVNGEIVLVNPIPDNEEERTNEQQWLVELGIGTGAVADVVYNTGDEVTIGTEKFRVLKDNGSTLTLLTEKNITRDTLVQSSSTPGVAFSSTNYWSSETSYPLNLNTYTSESIVSTDAIEIAKAYGEKLGGTGRLMTVEEVEELGGSMADGTISACPTWINQDDDGGYLCYWLGSAHDGYGVWFVLGVYSSLSYDPYDYDVDYGVRPVITISESAVN